jgi:hypothetical protein
LRVSILIYIGRVCGLTRPVGKWQVDVTEHTRRSRCSHRRGSLLPDHVLTSASDTELTRFRREHVGFVFSSTI